MNKIMAIFCPQNTRMILIYTTNQNVQSLRLLEITFLFKRIMQQKITYSYPIYHLLSRW